jgi:hypothetical protein
MTVHFLQLCEKERVDLLESKATLSFLAGQRGISASPFSIHVWRSSMPYAILRFEKQTCGAAGRLEAHHEREKKTYASNPDIDKSRSKDNYHLVTPKSRYSLEINRRIQAAGCKTRKNSITFMDTFIGGTPEFLAKIQPARQKEYFTRALEFMKKEVGEQNIISAVVHMDEKTPHMHFCFTPITEDNRLSAKEIIGNKPKLVEWQDRFHAFMAQRWLELERGEPASETKRKHIPVQLFKQAQSLDKQLAGIEEMLTDVNVFNIVKKREAVLLQLAKWLPKVQSFERQIDGLYMTNSDLVIGNNFLKSDIKEKSEENMRLFGEVSHLRNELSKQKKLLEMLPDGVLKQLREMSMGKKHDRGHVR